MIPLFFLEEGRPGVGGWGVGGKEECCYPDISFPAFPGESQVGHMIKVSITYSSILCVE